MRLNHSDIEVKITRRNIGKNAVPVKEGASLIIEDDQGRVLLLLRDEKPGLDESGKWDIPGGHIEIETPTECIKREMAEELELDLDEYDLRVFKETSFPDRLEHTFRIKASLDLDTQPLHEGQRLQYFSKEEIDELASDHSIAFGFESVLNEYFKSS